MDDNELRLKAIEIARQNPSNFSVTLLQRKLKIGYIACNKLMELLENEGVVKPYSINRKGREVIK